MLLPWVAGLAALLPSLVLADHSFENTAIVRTVDLLGSLVHTTTTYAVKALEGGATTYTLALSEEDDERTHFFEVKLKGSEDPLPYQKQLPRPGSHVALYDVQLLKALGSGATANLVLDTVQTHAIYPWPKEAGQNDEQAVKYDTELFVLSPYNTAVQRTKIRAPSPKIISFTTPEAVDAFAGDSVATKSGATVTYGPFNNFGPSASPEFVEEHQKQISVRYNHEYPMLEVKTLRRAAEISHWGANLNIQDEVDLRNAGPALKGHFSRLEHQTQVFYKRETPTVLKQLALQLPAGIRDAYYIDLIGNVSTSKLRTVPSLPKNAKAASHNRFSTLELKPRYPLLGGWNYTFTLGWDAPLQDSASWDAKNGRWIVAIPIMTQFPAAVVDDAEVKVIFPEGATDIEVFPPFPPKMMTRSTHTTYLDTVGRPTVTFLYEQLTDKHMGTIYVAYKVSASAHLKKPFAVATAFFSVFVFALLARRVDLSIEKTKK